MISSLFRRLAAPAPDRLDDPDARLALAALMVRVARSDGGYSDEERTGIDRILMARHGISPFEATALRTRAEAVEAGAADSVRFTRAIKDAIPLETRTAVVEALWEVALADGSADNGESSTLRLLAGLLGVTDLDSGLARQRVLARRG